jgi:hypothetical protein
LDMADNSGESLRRLGKASFNCLTTVAALGFGDIPPDAFSRAFNLIQPSGWIAFNIKSDFLDGGDSTGFARLIRLLISSGHIEELERQTYRHRLSIQGEPLYYTAFVARKKADIPPEYYGC